MIKLDDREAGLLRTAHLYADNDGVAFNGHNMILLLAKIDAERLQLTALLQEIKAALSETHQMYGSAIVQEILDKHYGED